jgi:hypothetical protein
MVDVKETLSEMNSTGIRVQSPTLQAEISKRKVNVQNSFLARRMCNQKALSLGLGATSPTGQRSD